LGFILYIHGGYWQRGDKSVYSFIAKPFVNRGYSVAVMNYQMCPDVKLTEIAPQARNAIKWLWNNSSDLNISRDNFNVLGHSAGGHLTSEMLFTNWSQEDQALPKNLLHAAVAVSGIYDFEPILYCSENDGLGMDLLEAKAASLIHRKPSIDIPHILSFGLNEPLDMHRQSLDYAKAFADEFSSLEVIEVNNADHFETVDAITDENGELFNKTIRLFES
jgi:arylformamidase